MVSPWSAARSHSAAKRSARRESRGSPPPPRSARRGRPGHPEAVRRTGFQQFVEFVGAHAHAGAPRSRHGGDALLAVLARALTISARSLHRLFATTDETVAGYIRRRRLEQARPALTAPGGGPSIAELAARWQFTDGSHFIRAFKQRYGQTPPQCARSTAIAEFPPPPGK